MRITQSDAEVPFQSELAPGFSGHSATKRRTYGCQKVIVNAMALQAPLQVHHDNDFDCWEVQQIIHFARQ